MVVVRGNLLVRFQFYSKLTQIQKVHIVCVGWEGKVVGGRGGSAAGPCHCVMEAVQLSPTLGRVRVRVRVARLEWWSCGGIYSRAFNLTHIEIQKFQISGLGGKVAGDMEDVPGRRWFS